MKIEFTHDFMKIFIKRFSSNAKLHQKFDERTRKFAENPNDPILKDHELAGKLQGHYGCHSNVRFLLGSP